MAAARKSEKLTLEAKTKISSEAKSKYEENKKIIYSKNRTQKPVKSPKKFDFLGYSLLAVLVAITFLTYPDFQTLREKVTILHVWYFGWITAIATGAGVLPFFFFSVPDKFWMGVSNALAGGMMIAASYSLAYEGSTFSVHENPSMEHSLTSPGVSTAIGFLVGIVFIVITKTILDQFDDLKLGEVKGASAQKMVLIIFVMTLHSMSEGIGIGVSFGGKSGMQLGQFISLSLAMHNVPEGLAVSLVLTARRVSKLRAGLWSVFTSLPQPLMAIPAFIFVERFVPMLPVGLGFASGAMAYVAFFELLVEAVEDSSLAVTGGVGVVAFFAMMFAQEVVKVNI